MMKRVMMAAALLLCLCLLTACTTSEPERFNVGTLGSVGTTQNQTQTSTDTQQDNWDEYDPRVEEDGYTGDPDAWAGDLATPEPATATPAPTVRGEYAGATPVPIDPIDKPTPTQVPPLAAFSYKTYEATKLGLSFDAPVGWIVDDSDASYYTIQNPNAAVNYPATLTVHTEKQTKQLSESELKTVIKNMLNAIGANSVVVEFSPSDTASRTLLETKGVYANYTAVLEGGIEISGRVHATCVEKVLYTVHIHAPRAYWTEYKDGVYDKLRDTIKITK